MAPGMEISSPLQGYSSSKGNQQSPLQDNAHQLRTDSVSFHQPYDDPSIREFSDLLGFRFNKSEAHKIDQLAQLDAYSAESLSSICSLYQNFQNGSSTGIMDGAQQPVQLQESLSRSPPLLQDFASDSRPHHPGDQFTFDNVIDDPPDANWNQTFADLITDNNHRTACTKPHHWKNLERALALWIQIADDAKVPWMLAYGTLFGYARDRFFISHDQDADIVIPSWSYELLQRYSTVLPIDRPRLNERGFLFLHPEFPHIPYRGRRGFMCNGTVTREYDFACAFLRPIGRLFVNKQFIDLFAADHYPDLNDSLIYNEGFRVSITPANRHFPRRRCTFANLPCWCPNDYVSILRAQYGPGYFALRPEFLCNPATKKHVNRKQDPEFFKSKDKEWNDRWGTVIGNGTTEKAEANSFSLERRKVGIEKFCREISPLPTDMYLSTSLCRVVSM